MPRQRTYRVFVAYTAQDLSAHADVVAKVLRALEHLAVDHRDAGATGQPSVEWCMERVDESDFLVVLVAHRYGWIPVPEEGGDGRRSITQMEVDRARSTGKPVLAYLVEDDATWPTNHIEGLSNPDALSALNAFKAMLRGTVASFFTDPDSLDGPLSRDIPRAIARTERADSTRRATGATAPADQAPAPWLYDPDNPPSLEERMTGGLPKRVLSIQGGGVHAAVTIGFLERIERLLQVRYGDPDFRLADYFDLVGSVGPPSLLALELARRRSVAEAADTLKRVLQQGFRRSLLWRMAGSLAIGFRPRYDRSQLRRALVDHLGEARLSDGAFTTGVAVIATCLKSARPAFISNHRVLLRSFGDDLHLVDAALACLATPGLFAPAVMRDARGNEHILYEGAASVGPDPSLALMLLVTSRRFPFQWRLGQHRLSVTTVGFDSPAASPGRVTWAHRSGSPLALLGPWLQALTLGAEYQSRLVLEALTIEGPAAGVGLLEQTAPLTHRRYATALDELARPELAGVGSFDSVAREATGAFDRLMRLGEVAAAREVEMSHFPESFDVRVPIEMAPGGSAERADGL